MYNAFFGLLKSPFELAPDPTLLFMTDQHREALAALTYSIVNRKGFIALTGEAGTGKTTILNKALQLIPARTSEFSLILNPAMTPAEFLEMALLDFGITDVPVSKAQRLVKLHEFLLRNRRDGKLCLLVVDEAHVLSPVVLEEIRLLTNFEHSNQKLLQILLLGQPELAGLLNRDDLRQLKQRIAVRLTIQPLQGTDIDNYLRYRWTKAGARKPLPFDQDAVREIAAISRGIPRVINTICDNALLLAFGEGKTAVDSKHVTEAAIDLDLRPRMENATPVMVGFEGSPTPDEFHPFETLERYSPKPAKPSLIARWAGKLGLSQVEGRA